MNDSADREAHVNEDDRLDAASALCVRDGKILLVSQPRFGGDCGLEIPGGRIETGETPEITATRELYEEAGYPAHSTRTRLALASNTALTDAKTYLVSVATTDRPASEHAEYESFWFELSDALKMIVAGEVVHAPTVAGVLFAIVEGEIASPEVQVGPNA